LASELGVRVRFVSPLEIYFPNRKENFSTLNPMASLREQKFFPSGIINLENSYDKNFIYVSIEKAQELIDYSTEEVTSVNIYFKKDYELKNSSAKIRDDMQKILGTNYYVKDRFMQNDTLYKMMRSEKFAVYMILFFVIIIVSFNIFGSLSMLMIDKKEDIAVLRSMGAGDKLINNIFILQGFLISLLGAIIGVILGVLISFIQYKWGIVSMPGNFIINYYPVKIELIDILITFLGVALIGYIIANVPVRVFGKK
jgi:ABC-type transport system, involved in lipoprotein release, permease component